MTESPENSARSPLERQAGDFGSPPEGPLAAMPAGLWGLCVSVAGGVESSTSSSFAGLRLEVAGLTATRYGQFLTSLSEPACCWLLEARAGSGLVGRVLWLELSGELAHSMVDRLLGGPARAAAARPFTSIDRRLLLPFVNAVAGAVQRACRIEAVSVLCEERSRPPEPARPGLDEPVFVARFSVWLGGQAACSGVMSLCLPGAIAELATALPQAGEAEGQAAGQVELSATTAEMPVPQDQLNGLAVGDVLVTDCQADGDIVVRLNDREAFAGRLGTMNGKRAVTITRPAGGSQ